MTDQEAREKYPNISKLADFINRQDRLSQFADMLLPVALAAKNGRAAE